MANPTRGTIAGRVYNDLRNLARRTSRFTDEYVLERFLYRLASSSLGREHFVLKGGLLLAQFGARRITRDIDILGRSFPGTETEIIHRVAAIAATGIDDGVAFDPKTLKPFPIREEDAYHGLRLSMAASIARARLKLQLDISFGDPVIPGPRIIDYPQQLTTDNFQILGYPLATVITEKLSTAISLGDLNTRDRDYGGLYRLLTLNDLDGQELTTALTATATHRGITLKPLSTTTTDLGERRQTSYTAWRRRQGIAATSYPGHFTDVVRQVTAFADILFNSEAIKLTWSATSLTRS